MNRRAVNVSLVLRTPDWAPEAFSELEALKAETFTATKLWQGFIRFISVFRRLRNYNCCDYHQHSPSQDELFFTHPQLMCCHRKLLSLSIRK